MFLVSLAEGFIHLFHAAGKIFLDMMTGLIPMLICLLLAINFLMKLVGTVRMEKVAVLLGRSRILTYGVLPVLGWFFMSSPGALTLGKLLPEKSKPGYEDALGTTAHPLTSLFPHVVPSELFVWLGVAAGVKTLGLPVTSLALRDDPDATILTERLAGELALARVTEQALLARRTLLAGMREPNIANVKEAQESLGKTTVQLDEELSQLKLELDFRQALTRNTASQILQRKQQRDQLQGQVVVVPDDSDSRLHNLNNPQPDSPR